MNNIPVILVVEDDKGIGDFLRAQLEASAYRVVMAATGEQGISLAASHCPELVLLDLGLPDMDGMEVLAAIRGWSTLPVVVVSARRQEEDIVRALDAGADDYITKPFSNSVLMARVRTALRSKALAGGGQPQSRQCFGGGSLSIDHERRQVAAWGRNVHLTPIEYKILALLAQNAGQVITYAAIRRELWGPYAGDNRILRVNMANLRRKIEENSADPRFVLTEVGVGYRMVDADEPGT